MNMTKIFYKPKIKITLKNFCHFQKFFYIYEKYNIQPIVYGSLAYAFLLGMKKSKSMTSTYWFQKSFSNYRNPR